MNKAIPKFLQLCALMLCVSLSVQAEDKSGSIKGAVITADKRPAENVEVVIKALHKAASTDNSGAFNFENIPDGTWMLEVDIPGYAKVSESVLVAAGRTSNATLQLNVSAQQLLHEVVIQSARNKYKTDKPSQSLRLNEPLLEIPQNVQVVSAEALKDQQVTSMSDGVIRNVSGVTRLEHWGDMYTRINARGSQLSAFRNGFNVVNSAWGPLTEDMSFVDHIEFVKGPAGFMLANGDPSGLYNVVTKKPTGRDFNGSASLTLGSFDLYRATVDLDGKFDKKGKVLYRLNLMNQTKGSFRPYEFNDRYSIAPVITYKIDDKTSLTFEYTLQHAKMSNVGSYYVYSPKGYGEFPVGYSIMSPGLDPTKINDHSAFLNFQHKLDDHWKLTAQAAYFSYNQIGSSMWPSSVDSAGNMIRSVSIWDAASTMKLGQVFLNGDVHTGPVHHRILAGLDMGNKNYLADWNQSHNLDTPGSYNIYTNNAAAPANGYPVFDRSQSLATRAIYGNIDQRYSAVYVQDELGFLDNRVRLTLAGRYTDVSQASYGGTARTAQQFTPRIGLSVSVARDFSVYALYDQAFTPQAGVLRSGADIKPITGNNMEAGLKKDWFDGKWNTTLSVYRILKNNELTSDPANTAGESFSIVLGQKRAQGVEFDLKGQIVRGLNLIANYAYTDARVTEVTPGVTAMKVNDRIPGFAKHNINAWLNYGVQKGFLKGVGVSGGISYQKDRDTWTWGQSGLAKLPDYLRVDAGLFWEKGNTRVTANMFNVMNKFLYSGSYYGYGSFYYYQAEAPRNMRLTIAYKF
ncbi:MAG: TonB-dependent receptor [Chitinophagaceae bacterium]